MVRREDWPLRLAAFVEAARARPFSYGDWDCCLMAAAWVNEATGVDHAADLCGRYADEPGAAALLADRGGVQAIATAALGNPIRPAFAQRGDLVMIETPRGPALGVCIGADAVFPGARGAQWVPMAQWRHAWRV